MPEISIIVPVYKVELYLRRCIDSILAQTFTDYELILVDDGSPDNCPAICDEYAQKDSRVVVIHMENGGVSAARNSGLDIASGKYVMFCDSDDVVLPQWCEVLYDAICQYPNAFIVADLIRTSCTQDTVELTASPTPHGKMLEECSYYQLYCRGISAYTYNKVYNRLLVMENNLRFDENRPVAEDVEFNVEYCKLCDRCIYIPEKLYVYCQNPQSAMRKYYNDWLGLNLNAFYCRVPLIPENDLPEYCDIWLYQFIHFFDNVFDERSTMTFLQKMRYNQRMIRCKEFRYCVTHASGSNESALVLKILKTHNYYLFWLFQEIVRMKNKRGGT